MIVVRSSKYKLVSSITPTAAELIIPDVYSQDVLSAVNWLQENLSFSDEYLAQLVGAPQELFCQWKRGEATLTSSQVQTLENLSTAINRLLSFFNFRRDLVMRVLEVHSDQTRRNNFTPPWVGTSLKDYLLHHGDRGIDEVDSWVQSLKFGDPL
jgi:hypothetical protein